MRERVYKSALRLRSFFEHALVTLGSALAKLVSGLHEILLTIEGAAFGAHYGVAVLGLAHSLKAVPMVMDSGQKLHQKGEGD